MGTDRRLIAVSVASQWFVLPDNGLITGVTRSRRPTRSGSSPVPAIRREVVSATFRGGRHPGPGRRLPVRGATPEELGPPSRQVHHAPQLRADPDEHGFVGEVIFRDTFGNLITNVNADRLVGQPSDGWVIEIAGERIEGHPPHLRRTPHGDPGAALVGSSGWVEVAEVNGDAARQLTAGAGTTVRFAGVAERRRHTGPTGLAPALLQSRPSPNAGLHG